ncbi:MAG: SDR family oxidoreductase [Nitrospiraceae bacterium]
MSTPEKTNRQVAIIPGGAKGIGRAVALDLAKKRWAVAICYRTSAEAAKDTAHEIDRLGGQSLVMQADVAVAERATHFVRATEERWGRIDALIHCAGPYHRVPLLEETAAGWDEMIAGNLHSLFHMAQAVTPGMIARKHGHIVAFGMANGDRMGGQPNVTGHYVAKAGVLILIRTLAKILAPHGIRANAVSPGYIDSGSAPADELAAALKTIPAGYLGSVDDVASAVRYLLSDESRYVNGANIQVSGAWGI